MYTMKSTLRVITFVATCALLAACASNTEKLSVDQMLQEKGLVKGESVDRISRFRVNGWQALDDQNLIIKAGVNDEYLITLRSFCFNLDNAFSIGVTSRMSSVEKFDQVIVQGQGAGPEYCSIGEIHRLTPVVAQS